MNEQQQQRREGREETKERKDHGSVRQQIPPPHFGMGAMLQHHAGVTPPQCHRNALPQVSSNNTTILPRALRHTSCQPFDDLHAIWQPTAVTANSRGLEINVLSCTLFFIQPVLRNDLGLCRSL